MEITYSFFGKLLPYHEELDGFTIEEYIEKTLPEMDKEYEIKKVTVHEEWTEIDFYGIITFTINPFLDYLDERGLVADNFIIDVVENG